MSTIRDLARNAGVSVGTVSRVLNGRPNVRPDLRHRVEQVIRDSGFRPDARARNLARGASGCIGFVVSNRPVLQPFLAWVLNGIAQCCEERGYVVVFERMHYSPVVPLSIGDLPRALQNAGTVDAVILAGTNYPNLVECLRASGVSFVLVGNSYVTEVGRASATDEVRLDHSMGGRQAVEFLMQIGHRNIWYVGDLTLPWYVERYEGYCTAMRNAGLEPKALVDGLSDDRFLNGLHSTELIISNQEGVSAIIGSTNEVAYGAWEALDRHGLRVPQDISLMGFDDEHTTHASRPLTCVSVDPEEEGRQLARMAIAKVQSPNIELPEVVLTPYLVKHSTCQPLSKISRPMTLGVEK